MTELLETLENGVAVLTLNRPASRNALSDSLMDTLLATLRRLSGDGEVRVVVLTGAGDAFCAGGDVKRIAARAAGPAPTQPDSRVLALRERMEISRLLHEMPKPTIAMIPGPAAGAGLSLALACDFRFAAHEAKFLTAFSDIGLSGDFGGSYFLTRLAGPDVARRLYLRGETIDGRQAEDLGVVTASMPRAALNDYTFAYALELARRSSAALALIKRNLNLAETGALSAVLDMEATAMVFSSLTEGHREAVQRRMGS